MTTKRRHYHCTKCGADYTAAPADPDCIACLVAERHEKVAAAKAAQLALLDIGTKIDPADGWKALGVRGPR